MKTIESLSSAELERYLEKSIEVSELLEKSISKYQDLRKLMSVLFEEPTSLENSFTRTMGRLNQGIQQEIDMTKTLIQTKS